LDIASHSPTVRDSSLPSYCPHLLNAGALTNLLHYITVTSHYIGVCAETTVLCDNCRQWCGKPR